MLLLRIIANFVLFSCTLSLHYLSSYTRGRSRFGGSLSMNMLTNMFSQGTGGTGASSTKQLGTVLDAPSWSELDEQLKRSESPDERMIFEDSLSTLGSRGPASHKATLRLFDAPSGYEPLVTLYRDTAAWCPYCEKVWLLLEEKRIPYRIEKVPMSCFGDKPASFFKLSPSGGIPVAIIKGRVVSESNDIMVMLEKEFSEHRPMWPSASDEKLSKRVSQLLALERRVFSQWFGWLTSNSEGPRASMHALLNQVDEELGKGTGLFLSGDGWEGVSVVDCMFAPFLERMDASLLFYKGLSLRGGRGGRGGRYPNVARWFDTMEARSDTYAGIRSDYYTHVTALSPQIGNIYTTKVH